MRTIFAKALSHCCADASTILSLYKRQLPADWERAYGYRPLPLETLIECAVLRCRVVIYLKERIVDNDREHTTYSLAEEMPQEWNVQFRNRAGGFADHVIPTEDEAEF